MDVFKWFKSLVVLPLVSFACFWAAPRAKAEESAKPLMASEKRAICDLIYRQWFKFEPLPLSAACSEPNLRFYKGIQEDADYSEFAVIGETAGVTHICKIYSRNADKAAGSRAFEIEGCSAFDPKPSCEATVKAAVAKSLVRKYPTIAHSFSVEDPVLKNDRGTKRTYLVASSDEVDSENWIVNVDMLGSQCKVTSLRLL
jgi:hypothetical protein